MWRKSSFSGSNGECVHVAVVGDTVGIIEADDPRTSDAPIVRTPLKNFRVFIEGVKAGEFDL
ncbi:DUF397 domain-containing protein [Allosalinactinospora lopnorensis]|uniref:DUF397 domain-containing protein n=1 Tax=Allosalinactinospora lopnorensis TaxID=1352348 RepID=UPI0009E32AF0|nr:DUF397 domain-containing protein [Allosalinactinospora lopnorensis]